MPAYLITGEAGTGKSSLAIELQKRGGKIDVQAKTIRRCLFDEE